MKYSPGVLKKAMHCMAYLPSQESASLSLKMLAEIEITARHMGSLSQKIGGELAEKRDASTDEYLNQSLPLPTTLPVRHLPLACIGCDGGRMQTREEGGPNGVQNPHWRETKNAVFLRMKGERFASDPQTVLPDCFKSREYMKDLLPGVGENTLDDIVVEGESPALKQLELKLKSDLESWRPERVYRTCLSSLCNSDAFGRLMQSEADSRGFFAAERRAYLGDGLPYNWTIQTRHFPSFTPILDFIHALERIYAAARCVSADAPSRWTLYEQWAEFAWQGKCEEMLQAMRERQQELGEPPKDCEDSDPRQVLASAITYFENNRSRMKYPEYRKEGLPITSAHAESYIKEVNKRVKGTEKFWNDGANAEAILQLRAGVLSDDERVTKHIESRPGNPYHPNVKVKLGNAV